MSWVLLVTAIFANGATYTALFPMTSQAECQAEIEWPGNGPYSVMQMGVDFTTECVPVRNKGEFYL